MAADRAPEGAVEVPVPEAGSPCEWFAMCTNEATQYVKHPVLDPVPTCDRCADRAK